MTIIQIAYDVPAETVAKIVAHLDHVAETDPDWNGAEFVIERDECTCIPAETYDSATLLSSINDIISGQY